MLDPSRENRYEDVRDRAMSAERSLGRIEGKLDQVNTNVDRFVMTLDAHCRDDALTFAKMSDRLSAIERWQSRLIGASIASGALAGVLIRWVFPS